MKRFLALIVAMSMVFSLVTVASADDVITGVTGVQTEDDERVQPVIFDRFKDVKGHWAEEYLRWAVKNGLMCGINATQMAPDRNITRGQMATMITRAFGATKEATVDMFIDLKPDDWCYHEIARAVQMGCLDTAGNSIKINEPVTREEVATTIVKAAAFTLPTVATTKFTDDAQIHAFAKPHVSVAVGQGIISGYADGSFKPTMLITRAQFAAMMYRLANAYMTSTASYGAKSVEGSLIVGVNNISLSNMTIGKNVFLSDGVGDGSVVFDSTIVKGTVYVRGTGTGAVRVKGQSSIPNIVFCNPSNAVRLIVEDNASVGTVTVQDAVSNVSIEGTVGSVAVLTGKAPVKLLHANCGNITLSGKMAGLSVDSTSRVQNISVASTAIGADLDLDGQMGDVTVDASDVTVSLKGQLTSYTTTKRATNTDTRFSSTTKVGTVSLESSGGKPTVQGIISKLNISGADQEVSVNGGADITTISITGDKTKTSLDGVTVGDVDINADDVELTGSGKVTGKITVTGGTNIVITIPGAKVVNKSKGKVYVGDTRLNKDESVVVDDSGNDISDDDKKNHEYDDEDGYKLTLDAGDGTVHPSSVRTNSEGKVQSLPEPKLKGYTFLGWFTKSSGGTEVTVGSTVDKSRTLYAHWEKVGGTTTNPDPEKPSTPQKITMRVRIPTDAQPSDLGFDNQYQFTYFGDGLSMDENNSIKGTLNNVSYLGYPSDVSGYYLPLVITPSVQDDQNGVLTVDNTIFDSSIVSTGINYKGKLVVCARLNPAATGKSVTISYDPDGEGTAYEKATLVLDYSKVTFAGYNGNFYDSMLPAPGVNGAETAVIKTFDTTQTNNYRLVLTTEALLETKLEDRYGHWVGLRFPAPEDCGSALFTESGPSGTVATYSLAVKSENTSRYIDWYVDVTSTEDNKRPVDTVYSLDVDWVSYSSGTPASVPFTSFTIDMNSCYIAGEARPQNPVALGVTCSAMTDTEVRKEFGINIDDLGNNLKILENEFGGTLHKFKGEATGGSTSAGPVSLDGYYFPVKIEGKVVASTTIYRDIGSSVAAATTSANAETGMFTAYVLLQLLPRGTTAVDTMLKLVPAESGTDYTAVEIVLGGENVLLTDAVFVATNTRYKDLIPGTSLKGADLFTESTEAPPTYSVFRGDLTIKGELASQSNCTVYDEEFATGWFVPVTLKLSADVKDWAIEIFCGREEEYFTLVNVRGLGAVGSDGTLTLALPYMVGDSVNHYFTLVLWDAESEQQLGTVVVAVDCEIKE